MSITLCGVCKTEPKKYKCPTCSTPYCSLACFKTHKVVHETSNPVVTDSSQIQTLAPPSESAPPSDSKPPLPPVNKQHDFSVLSSDTRFQSLLTKYPALHISLQRVYAATLEPDPEDVLHSGSFRGRGNYRGRGRGNRGGRWRGGGGRDGDKRKWSPKKGEAEATRLLARFRNGKEGAEEETAMGAFVKLVDEMFGDGDGEKNSREAGSERMETG
ncbi:hypothetical protein GQ43DRAFT_451360 [Delitschia confertaspora ATCC 74209]|uniref:HIT-type domain-containing protein n=1 Tax=Delitschia confertaspora ATCC 74209 TaxID=1513339 RepID=A0A9P4JES6_9PLEO|nr:hypothetical protein GQ43DRAFT_451360 [Delitschia confertaspora ATCC 74209]